MSEEKREEHVEEQGEQPQCECGHNHGHHGLHGGWRGHMIRRRMMMHFASMTIGEEIELLEGVKERLDGRLAVVNERLAKLKA
jgi:hypothetical protein